MSQFYASIEGNKGEATRMGTKESGIAGHIRGWNIGCYVSIEHVEGKDKVTVFKTGGSKRNKTDELIAEFTED